MISNDKKIKSSDSFPRYLYKFRYFDKDDYHLRILTQNEIFFASPSLFNDPYDCRRRKYIGFTVINAGLTAY